MSAIARPIVGEHVSYRDDNGVVVFELDAETGYA